MPSLRIPLKNVPFEVRIAVRLVWRASAGSTLCGSSDGAVPDVQSIHDEQGVTDGRLGGASWVNSKGQQGGYE